MTKVFEVQRRVRHGHTDPAGIVFYPRYFEMINDTVEDFFREELGRPFGEWHLQHNTGIPTVHIETSFFAPSYCDDVLTFALRIQKLGQSSATFEITATCKSELRLRAVLKVAHVQLDEMKSIPLGEKLRAELAAFLLAEQEEQST